MPDEHRAEQGAAIARLEHELGVSLFDRSATPITVTEHGAALQAGAQRILAAVQAAHDEVEAVSGRVRGTVILDCTLHVGPLDLAAVLGRMRDRHPGVIVHLRQSLAGSAGNLRAVADGSMDMALTASPADHRLSASPRATVTDLADETILRFPPGWGVRTTVDSVLGADPSAIEVADYALMFQLVRGHFGTTLVPASAVTCGEHLGLTAVPVDDPRLTWNLSAAISASRQPPAATAALLAALTQAAGGPSARPS